jgi:hypothetical protein
MLLALLFGSVLFAATALDARHTAVLDAITNEGAGMSCTPAQLREEAVAADIRPLGRVEGDDVVIVHLSGGCLCGAHNCPVYALRLTSGKPRVLMSTYGYGLSTHADAALPRIVVRGHDSALVIDEETYAYRGGRYVEVGTARVRADTGARKSDIAVRFAPGASSARLHGSASIGWYDAYTFDAAKGQRLLVDGVRSSAIVRLSLFGPGSTSLNPRAGVPLVLPASGSYQFHVDNDAEQDVPYALTLAITSPAPVAAPQPAPDAALMRWALSIPEVRCVPFAFGAWSNTRTDTSGAPTTLISGQKFAHSQFSASPKLTLVAGIRGGDGDRYYLARVPSTGATVMGLDGVGNEDTFTAVIAGTTAPPRAVAALPSAPRVGGAIGLGSTRALVESVLGTGRAKASCGFDVVHYTQSQPRGSVAELWFFYRNGVVTAIAEASGA